MGFYFCRNIFTLAYDGKGENGRKKRAINYHGLLTADPVMLRIVNRKDNFFSSCIDDLNHDNIVIMPQVSKKFVAKEIEKRIFEVFEKTLADLKDKDEVKNFIADIFTPTEKIMFSKRLAIAVLLAKGCDYREIEDVLKVSSTTINSILKQQSINGSGYKKAVEKILRNESLRGIFMDLTKLLAKGMSHPSQWGKVDSYYSYKKKKLQERGV